ncbi:MAG: hypothetical protein A3J65_03200 [Candidatus Buchananbacteria bacterium RIFCSPHIGHO2_02_FULL_45_11b]|uniref:Uncharacterized protein n=4 Tax=Candidatus Buchananiibacteriota TaxID=1817903 RepID=A0A1G1YNS1_9BACT|nr:MAG: hypothetical protein A2663_03120 [Candidatus Buchananbacteria bacterium RIFCSPHIGHO2_01_FULL_46_12]OGY49888.1 MAG: hypothetical protein A3J65_03200 [Candidatus Buchananbacteria bacterium RIFCSPHIGHO2_02_FULL_45_11b]OGY54012.1 MAG: hypothetical protein A3B15_01660 [Candidatus Buchananbacteria bacterium RIFCSPLOWO2_01_FULL_45_31]OGY57377.1 MAG: hypothetical protein A3H67_00010 [Candidatus Buchananbacteria bacterium RIFCSPLOWO2_02_FULL_46_11b]
MSPTKNSNIAKESEKDELSLADPFYSEKQPIQAPETAETFTEADKERVKQEILEEISIQEEEKKPEAKPAPAPAAKPAAPAVKSPNLKKIESILEEDLQDAYFSLDMDLQQKFKAEGEKTAAKIERLLNETKVKTSKVLKLILDWLKMIPGINRFFLNQEAKIKTDRLIKMKPDKE